MDLLEPRVQPGQGLWEVGRIDRGQSLGIADPVADEHRDLRPIGRAHTAWERLDVVLPEGAGALFRGGLRVRRHLPDGGHRKRVDLSELRERYHAGNLFA